MADTQVAPKFLFGKTVATPNALNQIPNDEILTALSRHVRGDWGKLNAEDCKSNDRALVEGTRLLSAYDSKQGIRFWIITEWDRTVTTVLLSEDY